LDPASAEILPTLLRPCEAPVSARRGLLCWIPPEWGKEEQCNAERASKIIWRDLHRPDALIVSEGAFAFL
jgi:hypothetical protein